MASQMRPPVQAIASGSESGHHLAPAAGPALHRPAPAGSAPTGRPCRTANQRDGDGLSMGKIRYRPCPEFLFAYFGGYRAVFLLCINAARHIWIKFDTRFKLRHVSCQFPLVTCQL